MSEITFGELVEREPRLDDLLAEADLLHLNRPRGFCASAVWHGDPGHEPGFKARLEALVGPRLGKKGLLGSQEAYEVAAQTISEALPKCRHRRICRPLAPRSQRKRTARWRPIFARLPFGASLAYRMSDVPRGDNVDPETPMRVEVTTGTHCEEWVVPMKEMFPDACRKGPQPAGK
jgi:hypothetical protein